LRTAGRLAEALEQLQAAWAMGSDVIWLGPTLAHDAHWIGHEAALRGDWALAEKAMLLAASAAPGNADIHSSLGAVYERAGRWDEAERAFQKAVSLDPKAEKAYYNLGAFYWGRARWNDAAAAFATAARLDPSDAAAARYAVLAGQKSLDKR
jgi:Flp pilus assembly protein TadD